jgi:hypothetical protein
VQRVIDNPYFFIASEMRTGKSAIVTWAVQFLFEMNLIDRVIIVAPAPVRDVWADQRLGELAKHLWLDFPATVTEFHARLKTWTNGPTDAKRRLYAYVTNYEFLRSKKRLMELLPACGPRTMLVFDESAFIKNYSSQQTKACFQLRKACGRVVLLNGTPIFHSPMDLFSQGNILSPTILECPYITHYKARYAVQVPVLGHGGKPLANPRGGGPILKVASWTNLEDLQRRFEPYTVRRLQKDCLDLPPKLDPVNLTATLEESWPHYKNMRDELVVWFNENSVSASATAAVKATRLSQITSGFLGGVEDAIVEPLEEGLLEGIMIPGVTHDIDGEGWPNPDVKGLDFSVNKVSPQTTVEVGREKLEVLLWFIAKQLEADPNLHLVAWCRFRAEMFRIIAEVQRTFPQFITGMIMGGQKRAERLDALALLKPETTPEGPTFVCGIEGTGSFGLDMCAAHTCVTVSSGYSPGRSAQTLDRVYGPGQKFPIAYFNIVAVGPKGQRTIDHDILLTRLGGEEVATRTSSAWVKALTEE